MSNANSIQLPPDWLAHRYDPGHDAIHYIEVPRDARRKAPFLTDADLPPHGDPLVLRRAESPRAPQTPVHFIFHSAYCCSTLLANAYDRPGRAFSLKEPVLLNDIVGWRHRATVPPAQLKSVVEDGLAALARPFAHDEHCVIKPSNVVNGLAGPMIASSPGAGVVLLYAPLRVYLASIADKGMWGRMWVRDLMSKQMVDGLARPLGFTNEDLFKQSDLQVAAVGWLAQHLHFMRLALTWPDRIRTLNSETLVARPVEALAAVDKLFGLASDPADLQAIVDDVFNKHAKSGVPFDSSDRKERRESATKLHAEELHMVETWAAKVAEGVGLPMDLPHALMPAAAPLPTTAPA